MDAKFDTIAIVGIHTDIGKTLVSAVLAEALAADYWKPVQAGSTDNTDSMVVKSLLSNGRSVVHPEYIVLKEPMSPHAAAAREGAEYQLEDMTLPETNNLLLVETAGGLMSPLTSRHTMLDFVKYHKLPVFLVTGAYLGSINHTLLCVEVLKSHQVEVLGVIYSGVPNQESEQFIESYEKDWKKMHVPFIADISKESVKSTADSLQTILMQLIAK